MIKIDINNGKKVLEAENGLRLIDVLASQNIFIPSACGSMGKCGLCKIKVNGGAAASQEERKLLGETEIAHGMRLACQVETIFDMSIEIPSEFLGAKEFETVVSSKKMLTYDIVELTLALKQPQSINFNAGQYVTVKMPAHGDCKATMRPFSIASSSTTTSSIQMNIRLNPQGTVTPWIFNELSEGMPLNISGPRGNFYLRNTEKPILFVAGGSGMAPVRSILQTMNAYKINRKAIYFFGALTQKDLYYLDEMAEYEKVLPDFKFIPALSNEPSGSGWTGQTGLITEVMDRICEFSLGGYEAYLCGKPAMVEVCNAVLMKKGIDKLNTFFDLFNSPKPAMK
jgi:Na+-transporting NADH:ubiquinone oxidoreductase subunit F